MCHSLWGYSYIRCSCCHQMFFFQGLRRLFFPSPPDISPEERAQNVGRVLRKEADDVMTKWDHLNTDSAEWQRRLELALHRLMELQEAEDLLDGQLRQAEMVKEAWEPVADLLIDPQPEHIDRVKVRLSDAHFKFSTIYHHYTLLWSE